MSTRYYENLFNIFDEIFSDSVRLLKFTDTETPSRFNKLVSTSQFPPADVVCDTKTKKLTIQVALAGYSEENINLSFDGDSLKLIATRPEGDKSLAENEVVKEYVMQRGIKFPKHVESSWIIDPRYYSRESTQVTFKNGLLTIEIWPKEDMAPKNITLFGKLELDKPNTTEQIEEK